MRSKKYAINNTKGDEKYQMDKKKGTNQEFNRNSVEKDISPSYKTIPPWQVVHVFTAVATSICADAQGHFLNFQLANFSLFHSIKRWCYHFQSDWEIIAMMIALKLDRFITLDGLISLSISSRSFCCESRLNILLQGLDTFGCTWKVSRYIIRWWTR